MSLQSVKSFLGSSQAFFTYKKNPSPINYFQSNSDNLHGRSFTREHIRSEDINPGLFSNKVGLFFRTLSEITAELVSKLNHLLYSMQ